MGRRYMGNQRFVMRLCPLERDAMDAAARLTPDFVSTQSWAIHRLMQAAAGELLGLELLASHQATRPRGGRVPAMMFEIQELGEALCGHPTESVPVFTSPSLERASCAWVRHCGRVMVRGGWVRLIAATPNGKGRRDVRFLAECKGEGFEKGGVYGLAASA